MKTELSSGKRILALVAILFSSVAVMADLVIVPVIGQIYGYYPDNMNAVNYIVSGPALVLVMASLLTPFLFKIIDKKIVFIIGAVFFAAGTLLGVVIDDPLYICFTRTLVGVSQGIINVVGIAYIADMYVDSKMRAKITGYYNAALSLAGIIFSYFGGVLGTVGWMNTYKIYYFAAIPMLVLVILFIPSIKKEKGAAGEAGKTNPGEKGEKEPLGWEYWFMSFCFFITNIALGATVLYYLSVYVVELGIGDSVVTGTAAALKSVLGFFVGVAFGWIVGFFKRWTITLAYLIAAVGLVLMVVFPSSAVLYIIGTIAGLTYKIVMPYNYSHGFEIVPESRTDDAVAITTAVYGLGTFLSTYCAGWVVMIMKTEGYVPTWYFWGGVMLVLAVADFIAIGMEKKEAMSQQALE